MSVDGANAKYNSPEKKRAVDQRGVACMPSVAEALAVAQEFSIRGKGARKLLRNWQEPECKYIVALSAHSFGPGKLTIGRATGIAGLLLVGDREGFLDSLVGDSADASR